MGHARAESTPARGPWSFSKAGDLSCLLKPRTLLSLSVCLSVSPVWLRAFTSIPLTSASHSGCSTHHAQDSLLIGKLFALELHVRNAVKQNDLMTGGLGRGLPRHSTRGHRLLPSPRGSPQPDCLPGALGLPTLGALGSRGRGKATVPSLGIKPAAPLASFWQDTNRSGLLATPRHTDAGQVGSAKRKSGALGLRH